MLGTIRKADRPNASSSAMSGSRNAIALKITRSPEVSRTTVMRRGSSSSGIFKSPTTVRMRLLMRVRLPCGSTLHSLQGAVMGASERDRAGRGSPETRRSLSESAMPNNLRVWLRHFSRVEAHFAPRFHRGAHILYVYTVPTPLLYIGAAHASHPRARSRHLHSRRPHQRGEPSLVGQRMDLSRAVDGMFQRERPLQPLRPLARLYETCTRKELPCLAISPSPSSCSPPAPPLRLKRPSTGPLPSR